MNLTRVSLVAAVLIFLALPVHAAPVLPDPGYGVRGGVVGSIDYPDLGVDTGFIEMSPCSDFGGLAGLPTTAYCQPYDIPDDGFDYGAVTVFSVDMLFNLFGGIPIPNSLLNVSMSDFPNEQKIGLFLVRISDTSLQCEETYEEGYFGEGEFENCEQLTAFIFPDVGEFEGAPSVSIPAFNVPEPASLFLMATGLAAAAARRLRRKRER